MGYNIAIFGATGLVGRTMLKVLEERKFPIDNLRLIASERSKGMKIDFNGYEYTVEAINDKSFDGMDIALFSAGGELSKIWAPVAKEKEVIVIDNSSAFRMDKDCPLVVPEVNAEHLKNHKFIIANPNCSTIQMVVALKPISDNFGLKRVVVSTYQSISGAGQQGVDKLMNEINDFSVNFDGHRIAYSTMFHKFEDDGFTNEEHKMINETKKIMDLPELKLAVTCVRVPTLGGHGESINLETNKAFTISQINKLLSSFDGLELMDDPKKDIYPTPQFTNQKDPVYVGRIREDKTAENGLYMWVVADNLRKGAATNAVQIAEKMIEMGLVGGN